MKMNKAGWILGFMFLGTIAMVRPVAGAILDDISDKSMTADGEKETHQDIEAVLHDDAENTPADAEHYNEQGKRDTHKDAVEGKQEDPGDTHPDAVKAKEDARGQTHTDAENSPNIPAY